MWSGVVKKCDLREVSVLKCTEAKGVTAYPRGQKYLVQ